MILKLWMLGTSFFTWWNMASSRQPSQRPAHQQPMKINTLICFRSCEVDGLVLILVVVLLMALSGGFCQSVISDDIHMLLDFKSGIVEDPLGSLANWSIAADVNASTTPCDGWPGVSCNAYQRVVAVRLAGQQLNGSIHASIASLPFLKTLDLSNNNFSGDIPPALFMAWRLKQLNLSSNLLSGGIVPQLGNLTKLQSLHLQNNQLSGFIPPQLANCTSLAELDVGGNRHIGGLLPGSLGGLKNLSSFRAAGNNICGGIPSDFTHLASLSDLDLSDNQLGGDLSETRWTNLTRLTSLRLGYNQFTGNFTTLPEFFGLQHELQVLSLTHNKLTGSVSPNLWRVWRNLTSIDISSNGLTGAMPLSLKKLQTVKLGNNSLSGVIPESLGKCTSLVNFNISGNNISSGVPVHIYFLTHLLILDLSHNNLTGDLPRPKSVNSTQLFPELLTLDLSHNHLTGPLPFSNTTVLFPQLLRLDISYNNLNGYVPVPSDMRFFLQKLITLDMSHNLFQAFVPSAPIGGKRFTALQIYDLSASQFAGPVPDSLGDLQNLKFLSLFQNRFSGRIPASLGNCTSLLWLDLQQNNLDGDIPDTLSNLTAIRVLSLSDNHLTGPIPPWIGTHFKELQILNLARNKFVSSFPRDLSGFDGYKKGRIADSNKTLELEIPIVIKGTTQTYQYLLQTTTAIDVSDNALEGDIPDALGDLVGLQSLNMSHNTLRGRIPSSLGKLQLLESLDLSVNHLSGEIPSALSNLKSLASFNLSSNNLTGFIPTGSQMQTFGVTSYEGNPELCGSPLPPCKMPPPAQSTGDVPPMTSDEGLMDIRVFSIASIASFIAVLAFLLFSSTGWKYMTGGSGPKEPKNYVREYGFFTG